MLQRAASNAYSWWWASHIRTKQSKWLEQNLQDMEEKVEIMLKLIQEDGDSFAKRAEMYYKKRPELINFVEESYRAYRSLAERYDHISTELQNANNTIASVFPEQVQFMDEDDEDGTPNVQKKFPEGSKVNIPKVPKLPTKDLKGLLTMATKKLQPKKASKSATTHSVAKSGLSKPEAVAEIDKLQKGILALQTEKEFVKSSYENGLAKYWEIEKQINEMQEKICHLQDEFSVGAVIEDDEARNLMAASALKSCQETLIQLQEKQEKSNEEARVEQQRIKDARVKLDSLKDELLPDQEKPHDQDKAVNAEEKSKKFEQEVNTVTQERQDLELLREKIKEQFEVGSNSSLTVNEMAEQIDRLVNKVISLETAVSSQSALINRLRTETDELQAQIRCLEGDKGAKDDLSNKLKEMEGKLQEVQVLNQNVEDQNNNLQTHFTEAHCNLDHLSEKLHTVKPDEELEAVISSQKEEKPPVEVKSKKDDKSKVEVKSQKESKELEVKTKVEEGIKNQDCGGEEEKVSQSAENNGLDNVSQKSEDRKQKDEADKKDSFSQSGTDDGPDNASQTSHDLKLRDEADKKESSQTSNNLLNAEPRKQEDETNWQQLFKDMKKKLSEAEKQQDMKDEEIRSLRQKLSLLQGTDENKDSKESKTLDKQTTSKARTEESSALKTSKPQPTEKGKDEEEEDDIKVVVIDQLRAISPTEEKFRTKIDELLEQNLDFWLRFSTSFHQIQKFQTEVKDLQAEIQKVKEKVDKKQEDKKQEGSTSATTGTSSADHSLKSDARPIYRHLREIQTELGMWVEQSVLLKDELQSRFSSLCIIQEEISKASKSSGSNKEEAEFTSYEAAKFQGEVLNMKQENNKVAEELQAGLDHITGLQLEIEKTLATLNEEFGLSGSKNNIQLQHSTSKTRVPLQSFIFGTKPKKQRPSIFPALHWKYSHLKTGRPL